MDGVKVSCTMCVFVRVRARMYVCIYSLPRDEVAYELHMYEYTHTHVYSPPCDEVAYEVRISQSVCVNTIHTYL
jgi:hypothetical protein